jgi:hypothetical protein
MYKQDCCGCQKYAMASVPMQQWGELYDWYNALCNGTIFPDLNLEFWNTVNMPCAPKNCESRQEAMRTQIDQISFALEDLTLYLDTHPDCMLGLELFKKLQERRVRLLDEFGRQFYPLTIDSMMGSDQNDMGEFSWGDCPMPWEGGMCKCGTTRNDCNIR